MKQTKIAMMLASAGLLAASLHAEVIYNSIESPLPGNVVSEGFQSNSTGALGNIITPSQSGALLTSASVVLSDWALLSSYSSTGWGNVPAAAVDPAGFTVPLTLTIYSVGTDGTSVGNVLGSVTQNTLIAWRPESTPATCSDPTAYLAGDGNCYHGAASVANFDLSSLNITVPEQFIYGISYNTSSYGSSPLGYYPAPVDSLNVGLEQGGSPTVGSDDGTNVYYVAGTVNNEVFSESGPTSDVSDISGYRVEAQFSDNTPEPSTFGLIGIGLAGLAFTTRKRLRA